jgi:hypothetical protein
MSTVLASIPHDRRSRIADPAAIVLLTVRLD